MREILYRAISMARGEHWLYGQPRHYARNPHTEKWTMYDPTTGIETDIDEETLGQYTGLTDKNSTKIFEGDILKFYRKTAYVVFNTGEFCAVDNDNTGYCIVQSACEVVGNVHDSPDLLKGGEE